MTRLDGAAPATFRIAGRPVGAECPTLVIAEIGVNHDGSAERALELVEIAARCGADAVKLQVFRAARLMHPTAGFATYQREHCEDAHPIDMLRRFELSDEDLGRVVAAIRKRNLLAIATPFSPPDVDTLAGLAVDAVKIASPDVVNRPLLSRAARLNKPMLLSTGAATMGEVEGTAAWLSERRASFALLHCISSYPAADDDAHLCWVRELSSRFACPIGYSDHTTADLTGALAVAAGACVIERHLTYDRAAAGPDHAASSDAGQFARYVSLVRHAERLRGRGPKRVLDCEQDVRTVSRQSLVAARDLRRGQLLREDDLTVQRPGTGISCSMLDAALARRARVHIPAGTILQWGMLEDALDDAA